MAKPIDVSVVEARMRDLAQTTANQTISLFKGGTFALAAVLLVEIVTQPDGRMLRLVLWGTSFIVALISYNSWLNSSVIDFRESVGGVVIMIVQMMTELILFAVLAPRFNEQAWRGWVLVYGAFMAITAARMTFFSMNRNVAIDASLRPLIDRIDADSRRVARSMVVIIAVALALSVPILGLAKDSPWPQWLSLGFALVFGALNVFGLVNIHRERLMMEQMIQDALDAGVAKETGAAPHPSTSSW